MIRSTTDEMLAARFDPEPWVSWGVRYATRQNAGCYFDPRPEFIPSRFTTRALGQLWELPRSEPNPILVRLRAIAGRDGMHVHEYAPSFRPENIWQWAEVGTPDQIEDARKVVTRLAAAVAS